MPQRVSRGRGLIERIGGEQYASSVIISAPYSPIAIDTYELIFGAEATYHRRSIDVSL